MTNTFAIYESKDGKKYKMYPTLVRFDKKTEIAVGYEIIKTIKISSLKNFLEMTIGRDFEEPLQGSVDICEQNDFFIKSHINNPLNYGKYNYQLSFDEVEPIN